MKTVKIADSENGFLSFDLRDLLGLIENGRSFSWSLSGMDINIKVPNMGSEAMNGQDYKLIESIEASNEFTISWEELNRIAKLNVQFINGEIVGTFGEKLIKMNAFDSSYWTIESNQIEFINQLRSRFQDIVSKPL